MTLHAQAARPERVPLAVQLYTVNQMFRDDRRRVLTALADIGYGAIEAYDPQADPAGLRELAADLGLTICSSHAPLLSSDPAAMLGAVATLGADTVIVPVTRAGRWMTTDGIRGVADDLNSLAAKAAQYGLRLGYHNHEFELATDNDGRPGLELLADLLAPEVFLEVDIYWAAVAGIDVVGLLERLGPRVRYLHVKDGPVTRSDPQTAVGVGALPIPEILAAARHAEWHVVELDECRGDMLQALELSLVYLDRPPS